MMAVEAGVGMLLVDKPAGPTSHDAVAVARRALGTKKVGHAGTLDPFATGLLVLGVGRGTRLLEYMVGLDKAYVGTALLGVTTETLDPEGAPTARDDRWRDLAEDRIRAAAEMLVGPLSQVPPRFSAIKVGGVPAYERARRGEPVDLEPRPVVIHALAIEEIRLPHVSFRVTCSTGTYVRSLAADLGAHLDTGCHLTALRRTHVGPFDVAGAVSLAAVQEGEIPDSAWVDPVRAVSHLPRIDVETDDARRLAVGKTVEYRGSDVPVAAFVHAGTELVAVGSGRDGVLHPRKVFRGA